MLRSKPEWRETPAVPTPVDQLLADRYQQLLRWASALTRGDTGLAEEIVQELCLYFTLTQPNVNNITHVDGYLYTSLRHIYLSRLARTSREALRSVNVTDYDTFASALQHGPGSGLLEKQNDLRRICHYALWRRESSKSASYFLLHFFLGYTRSEIAVLACLPISAIYNKLKLARTEITASIEAPGKLRVVQHDPPPTEPILSWSLLSTPELFAELNQTIRAAHTTPCLPESELLAPYQASTRRPISCALLAHIVCCEHCRSLLDRNAGRPGPPDRGPLDDATGPEPPTSQPRNGALRKSAPSAAMGLRLTQTYHHCPSQLSIAVNGHIIAFHDVTAEYGTLAARIGPEQAPQFVEVFSEQDVRLAMLCIGPEPPEGATYIEQRTPLSDGRWLELMLSYDGQGLHSEVAYSDPAFKAVGLEEDDDVLLSQHGPKQMSRLATGVAALARLLRAAMPVPAVAWATLLALIFSTAGYLAYHHAMRPVSALETLEASIQVENRALFGHAEHQQLHIEERAPDGKLLEQGTIDLWKEPDTQRYLRRLYDAHHRPLASDWRNEHGEHHSQPEPHARKHGSVFDSYWDQDLSASAFRTLAGQQIQMRRAGDSFELSADRPTDGRTQLVSAVLVLDAHLAPTGITLNIRARDGVHQLRLLETSHTYQPRGSVPASVFDPGTAAPLGARLASPRGPQGSAADALDPSSLAGLQIGILYELHRLGADTGEPVEVTRTENGYIRVSGVVAGQSLRERIQAHLESLPNHQFLELELAGNGRDHSVTLARRLASRDVYDVNARPPAADALLRQYFQAKNLSGDSIDAAVITFSQTRLDQAQHALQHAYALQRLGGALSTAEFAAIPLVARRQWTEMVQQHASGLEQQLQAIHTDVAPLASGLPDTSQSGGTAVMIKNPSQFNQAASELLARVQQMDERFGDAFASRGAADSESSPPALAQAILETVPLADARSLLSFSIRLASFDQTATQEEKPSRGPE
jgi:DNA-directed RNA polymerase specialized sigma24 family protein